MAASRIANDERLRAIVARQPYPLLFVTVNGAHLYGFPSPDSDYDLRGVHVGASSCQYTSRRALRQARAQRPAGAASPAAERRHVTFLTPDALASTLVRMVRKRTLLCTNHRGASQVAGWGEAGHHG